MLKSNFNSRKAWFILVILVVGVIYLTMTECIKIEKEINDLIQGRVINTENIIRQSAQEQEKILYIIDFGGEKLKSYQILPSKDSTVFSLLEKLAEKENFQLGWKIYEGMGVFVESIDGIKNGRDNKYWQYWVNNELPMIAADKREIKGGDRVEWKFAPADF